MNSHKLTESGGSKGNLGTQEGAVKTISAVSSGTQLRLTKVLLAQSENTEAIDVVTEK